MNKALAVIVLCEALAACSTPERGTVSSEGQSGGVTANTVGSVTQITPHIKSPYLAKLQAAYAAGAQIRRAIRNPSVSDVQIDQLGNDADRWANDTHLWISKNMTQAAAEKFLNRGGLTYSYDLPGTRKPEEKAKRENVINGLQDLLDNLDALMRSDEMYPQ